MAIISPANATLKRQRVNKRQTLVYLFREGVTHREGLNGTVKVASSASIASAANTNNLSFLMDRRRTTSTFFYIYNKRLGSQPKKKLILQLSLVTRFAQIHESVDRMSSQLGNDSAERKLNAKVSSLSNGPS